MFDSQEKPKWQREPAEAWAWRFAGHLGYGCAPAGHADSRSVEVAGSIRRGRTFVSDVEIICAPDPDDELGRFNNVLEFWLNSGLIAYDEEVKRNGPKYKRFKVGRVSRKSLVEFLGLAEPNRCAGIPVDLFIAEQANFGNILTIRTGGADFSQSIVKPQAWGGLMPDNMAQADGHLYRFPSTALAMEFRRAESKPHKREMLAQAALIPCPDERAFFREIGLPWVRPADRERSLQSTH